MQKSYEKGSTYFIDNVGHLLLQLFITLQQPVALRMLAVRVPDVLRYTAVIRWPEVKQWTAPAPQHQKMQAASISVNNKITNCDYTLAIDTVVPKPFKILGD